MLRSLPDGAAQTCVTSPPYWGLRDYGCAGQLGLEPTPEEYVARMVEVFREVRRVLCDDGTCWVNLGDSYFGAAGGAQGQTGQCADRSAARQGVRVKTWLSGGAKAEGTATRARSVARGGTGGPKPKDLVGIPWRVAFALQADGWWLRSDIIWAKPNPMPESVTDRCTRSHEYLFLLTKAERYYYDADAIKEPSLGKNEHDLTGPGYSAPGQTPQTGTRAGKNEQSGNRRQVGFNARWDAKEAGEVPTTRNRRDVWTIAPKPFAEAHFAVMPEALVLPCVLAGTRPGDTVLDPFAGSGTVGAVAVAQGRGFVGAELNPAYVEMARRRIGNSSPLFATEVAS